MTDPIEGELLPDDNMNQMQMQFCQAFVSPNCWMDQTAAARKAGAAYPSKEGHRWMQKPKIRAYIGKLLKPLGVELDARSHRTLQEIEAVAFADLSDVIDFTADGAAELTADRLSDLPKQIRAAVKNITVRETVRVTKTSEGEATEHILTRNLKVEMHNKTDMLKLLALMHELVRAPNGQGGIDSDEGWTGLTVIGKVSESAE